MKDIEEKRTKVMAAYGNSAGWVTKVQAMTDSQILAVYKRLLKVGAIRGAYR